MNVFVINDFKLVICFYKNNILFADVNIITLYGSEDSLAFCNNSNKKKLEN